jgi:Protein of unknown function (DUF3036).
MKRETVFLKISVYLLAALVLVFYIFGLPSIAITVTEDPQLTYLYYPILIGMYGAAVPFFIALYKVLRILGYIDKNKAFSDLCIYALKNIKYCAITIGIIYAAGIPLLYLLADAYDAPGILLFGFVIAFASVVIAVLAVVFQRLIKSAVDMKSE